MPLYEYECEECGHRFEKIQKFSDALESSCPSCGGKVRKLLSSPAIQFKGTGWYITDYARKPSGQAAETSSDGSSGPEKSESSKSDSSQSGTASSDKTTTTEKTSKTSPSSSSN